MKKSFSAFLIFLAVLLTFTVFYGYAKIPAKAEEVVANKKESAQNIYVSSKSAYLMDEKTNTVIYHKNETAKLPIASMCKIMTLLLCFESIDANDLTLDEDIVVSENASGMGGSQVFLESNATYKASELIKSVVVASANDASVALAERICGSEDAFVDRMNEKAAELKMDNTVFSNCTGLPKEGQFSCAKDVATMFSNLLKHKEYFKFSNIWMDKIEHPEGRVTEISNTNKLIRFYDGCDSGKTGYTSFAGHCLAASAERQGMRLISVIISAPDSKTRFKEASDMFNYGFANYVNKKIVDEKTPLDEKLAVSGGKVKTVEVAAKEPVFIFSKKNDKRGFEISYKLDTVKAPINKGEKVGEITVYENGVEIATVDVVALDSVEKAGYFDSVKSVIDNWQLIG